MKVTAENWAEVLLKKNEAKAFHQTASLRISSIASTTVAALITFLT